MRERGEDVRGDDGVGSLRGLKYARKKFHARKEADERREGLHIEGIAVLVEE
jgi:hypothetical protein